YDDKEENIDWNAIVEQVKEKHLDNIRKYQNLNRKPVSIAQARKNMIIYLKNMAGHKMEHFRGMTYDKVKYPIIDWEIHSEGSRTYWKIIRVGGITEAYQSFEYMLKGFNREDLVALWRLVKEKFKKDYPLSNGIMTLMLSTKLQVEEDSKMARDLVTKIFMEANKPKSRRINVAGLRINAANSRLMLLAKDDYAAEVTEEITLSS
nr:leucine-rich repeat protein [Tanacetum cinerariifolium]